jgi:hypothetical protein
MVAMLGKTLHYSELHTALSSSAICTKHRLRRKGVAGVGRPSSLLAYLLAAPLATITRSHKATCYKILPCALCLRFTIVVSDRRYLWISGRRCP